MPLKERSFANCLLIWKVNYWTVYPEKLFPWPPVCLLVSEKVASFFICEECKISFLAFGVSWRLKLFCMGQFAWIVKFVLRMFTFMTHCGENKPGSNKILFLPLTRIDFAALVCSRAVRISSRAVRVFPALSLRRVRPSYGTFSLVVL